MATDIEGFIEQRPPTGASPWRAADALVPVLGRSRCYDAFGCLFGVRNYADFVPLFAGRGAPPDPSDAVREVLERPPRDEDDVRFGLSWFTLDELQAADLSERAQSPGEWIHHYERVLGVERYRGKFTWASRVAHLIDRIHEEGRVEDGQDVYCVRSMDRQEAL